MTNNPITDKLTAEFKKFSPTLANYTTDQLFNEVWLDDNLDSKTRSLVTLSVLATLGNTEQMSFHIETSYKNGATQEELSALCTHLAFYIGWPQAVLLLNKIVAQK